MLSEQYTPALADLLFDRTDEFIGIYDLTAERFKRVNYAGASRRIVLRWKSRVIIPRSR